MKVLVVEDDVQIAQLLQRGLAGHFVVEVAATGTEGLDLLGYTKYDVIVLDIMLPDMDGMDLCAKIRNEGVTTPVLMLTARDSVSDKVNGLTAGADDYLTKPFAFDELRARLIALGRRAGGYMAADVMQTGKLEVYPEQMKALYDGRQIELTVKEFAVLELLLRNKGNVLSREVILDRVWGSDADPIGNVVDAVIARLRTKLKQIGGEGSLIKTVRGLGYKVDDAASGN